MKKRPIKLMIMASAVLPLTLWFNFGVYAAGPTGPGAFLSWRPQTRLIMASSNSINCVIKADQTLKCWGRNADGQLGKGHTNNLGDNANEMGANLTPIDLGTGRTAKAVAGGGYHACAILDNSTVKCWGYNGGGRLGLGDTNSRGDGANEMGDNLPAVQLGTGRTAKAIAAAGTHTCAILDNNTVKCWGTNTADGELGLGDTQSRGDGANEMGDNLPTVNLGTGRTALQITAGRFFTCARLDNNTVKCWGYNASGQLGQGHANSLGDVSTEMGDNLPAIDLGTGRTAQFVSAGEDHVCAILDNDTVKCWGEANSGQLGQGAKADLGNAAGEMGDDLNIVPLGTGRTAKAIRSFGNSTCAILDNNTVKCWGENVNGQLGQGHTNNLGDGPGEMGDSLANVSLGTGFVPYALPDGGVLAWHNCVISSTNAVKCWGYNASGDLGLGDVNTRGDGANEMGDNLPLIGL